MRPTLAALLLAACMEQPGPVDPRRPQRTPAPEPLEATLAQSCQSCHSLRLVEQQRLAPAQ